MAFSSTQTIITRFVAPGQSTVTRGNYRVAASADAVAVANGRMGASAIRAGKQMSFMENQVRFTSRRMLFAGTLAFGALGAAAVKMGFSYNNAIQTTRVALGPLFQDQAKLNNEIQKLYKIATFSPFLFKDTVQAFRQMYIAMAPLGISADKVVQSIQAIVDGLAVAGKSTPQNLNRASVALQHMAFMGRLTGITVRQLAQDGFPIYDILNKKLGVTTEQMHNIAALNIPSVKVLDAIIQYMSETPGFKGAAARLSAGTLPAAFAQFKDILSQGFGKTTLGSFNFLTKTLKDINLAMAPLMDSKKPVALINVVKAIDSVISPKSHIFLNVFITLSTAIHTVVMAIGGLFKAIQQILRPFEWITNKFGGSAKSAKILGYWIGFIAVVFLLYGTAVVAATIAMDFFAVSAWAVNTVMKVVRGTIIAVRIAYLLLTKQTTLAAVIRNWKTWAFAVHKTWDEAKGLAVAVQTNNSVFAKMSRRLFEVTGNFKKMASSAITAMKRVTALRIALQALPVLTPIAIAITIILLRKQIDKAVTGFLRSHHLGYFTGGQIDIYHTPYNKVPGFARSKINQQIATGKAQGSITAAQLAQLRSLGYPGAVKGGIVTAGGMAMVGEGGPEIVTIPAAASIIPLDRDKINAPGYPKFPEVLNLKTILRVDGKDLATVVAQHRLDAQARR